MKRFTYTKYLLIAISVIFFTNIHLQAQWLLTGNSGTTPGTNYSGTSDAVDFILKSNNQERIRLMPNGHIVFQTSTVPSTTNISSIGKVDFNLCQWDNGNLPKVVFDSPSDNPTIKLYRSTGFGSCSGSSEYPVEPWWIWVDVAGSFVIRGNPENSCMGSEGATMQDRLTILQNGKIGIGISEPEHQLVVNGSIEAKASLFVNTQLLIGTTSTVTLPSGFSPKVYIEGSSNATNLAVKGNILAEEVTIKLASTWPDYVFDSNYNLKSLDDISTYVNINKHLPDVPDASQVKSSGVAVGEMQAILLKKIEEITLYLIQMKKENADLQKQLVELKDQLK